jgi:membrane-associated phospholipid phosphatase
VFQIEPILFLQSFASDVLTAFMTLVSQMGYTPFYIATLSVVLFGINFRKGFILLQIVLWNGILTDLLKHVFALPRPSDVDSSVQFLGTNYPNPTPFQGMAGQGFFRLPDPSVIDYFRSLPEWSFGIPSGHVSGTIALWGGMDRLFQKKWIFVLGFLWPF